MSKLHSQQRSKSAKKAEKGQAIILVAFMMVGLIAMLGLVIDGGGLMYLQRDVQNTVDDAVVAATYAKCVNGNVTAAAVNAAKRNGFEDGVNGATVTVNSPPTSGPAAGNTNFVEVIIIAQKQPYFIQIVHNDTLSVTARAVGQCVPSTTNSSGRALFAGGETCGFSLDMTGANITITGGTHSNQKSKSSPGSTVIGSASYVEDSTNMKGTYDAGQPVSSSVKSFPIAYDITDYDSATDPKVLAVTSAGGVYTSYTGDQTFTDAASLDGIIYVDGDVTLKGGGPGPGGSIPSGTYYVTIVATGTIEVKGNFAGVAFKNYGSKPIFSTNLTDYLLFYSNHTQGCPGGGTSALDMAGNEFDWNGIVYAPNGNVTMSASSNDASIFGAIWANYINLSGSSLAITFDNTWLPPDPPKIGIPE